VATDAVAALDRPIPVPRIGIVDRELIHDAQLLGGQPAQQPRTRTMPSYWSRV
jgi:hypothetical protein